MNTVHPLKGNDIHGCFSMAVTNDLDVFIEYGVAACLAYKQWCTAFKKEGRDPNYQTFKSNFEAITVAKVLAAKDAHNNKMDCSKDPELNVYSNMTETAYMAMQYVAVCGSMCEKPATADGVM